MGVVPRSDGRAPAEDPPSAAKPSDLGSSVAIPHPLAAHSWRPSIALGLAYVKVGVILADLSPEGRPQGVLFDRPDAARTARLMQALDRINADFGRGTLVYAGSGLAREWAAVCDLEGPHDTTDWRQVPEVGA